MKGTYRVAAVTGWTILFFVVLRVAIGWHFLYEGYWKIRDGAFSSTPYLMASVGPLKDVFRGMVDDVDGFARVGVVRDEKGLIKEIKPDFQKAEIDKKVEIIIDHYAAAKQMEAVRNLTTKYQQDSDDLTTKYQLGSDAPKKSEIATQLKKAGDAVDAQLAAVRNIRSQYQRETDAAKKAELSEQLKKTIDAGGFTFEQQKDLADLAEKKKKELDELYGVTPRTVAMPTESIALENEIRAQNGLPPSTRPADTDAGVAGAVAKLADEDLFAQVLAYQDLLNQVKEEEKSQDPKYLQQRMEFNNTKINAARNALLTRVEKPCKDVAPIGAAEIDRRARLTPEELRSVREKEGGVELTEAQLALGPLPMPQAQHFPGKQLEAWGVMKYKATTRTEWQDLGMMFGLCAIGACLILGLFTRLAAFGAVTFLAMFYLSMPPWPGVVEVAPLEGHYHIVNKNLIELIACLMIMTSRIGRWGGLDAFIGAICDRRRRKRAESLPERQSGSPDRPYIPAIEGRTAQKV